MNMKISEIPLGKRFLVKQSNSDWSWIYEISLVEFSKERLAVRVSKQILPEGSWHMVEDLDKRFEFVDWV